MILNDRTTWNPYPPGVHAMMHGPLFFYGINARAIIHTAMTDAMATAYTTEVCSLGIIDLMVAVQDASDSTHPAE